MIRLSLSAVAAAKRSIAKSIAALIEVRPRNERGAASIVAATPAAASSSRTTVQSTTTFWSAAPDHSMKVTAIP
jgi:hypothetical protein